jgi:signal transduction histidine kinase
VLRRLGRRLGRFELLLGVAASVIVLVVLLQRPPGWEMAAIVGATLLPAGVVLYGAAAARRARELRTQRDIARQEAARIEAARQETQERLAELVTLNELAVALSSTLHLHELLDRSLQAVVTHLRFDRALVLLVDETRESLCGGHSVGGTDEMAALIAELELPLNLTSSQLVQLARADGPMLFSGLGNDPDERNRAFARALGVDSFLGTPLISKGRTVGVLAVDNRESGRDLARASGPLLFTLGNLIASAIETARLYEEIEAQNRALEARVEERTRELAAATVVAEDARAAAEEARAAAVEATETKSRFLANVSHELRTPLTSILGFTRIIRRRLDEIVFPVVPGGDPKMDRAVRQIGENLEIIAMEGDRLTHMINDVLDLAKIEAGKLDWREGPVEAAELVDRAAAATASLFEASGVPLLRDVPDGLPATAGDRDRLIQVVINLLSNAVKFTRDGSVTCRVRAAAGDEAPELVFSVIDTGMGIAPEDHARVFEQFTQAGDTLTDKPRGTGLGLPISRQIVEHHGGRMWLESEVGRGSTFSFSLPIRAAKGTDDGVEPGAPLVAGEPFDAAAQRRGAPAAG